MGYLLGVLNCNSYHSQLLARLSGKMKLMTNVSESNSWGKQIKRLVDLNSARTTVEQNSSLHFSLMDYSESWVKPTEAFSERCILMHKLKYIVMEANELCPNAGIKRLKKQQIYNNIAIYTLY